MGHIPTTDGWSNIKLNSMKTKVLKITTKILKYKIEFVLKQCRTETLFSAFKSTLKQIYTLSGDLVCCMGKPDASVFVCVCSPFLRKVSQGVSVPMVTSLFVWPRKPDQIMLRWNYCCLLLSIVDLLLYIFINQPMHPRQQVWIWIIVCKFLLVVLRMEWKKSWIIHSCSWDGCFSLFLNMLFQRHYHGQTWPWPVLDLSWSQLALALLDLGEASDSSS